MTPRDLSIISLVASDPARRRRLIRQGGIEAARRGLRGPYGFDVRGTAVVVSSQGIELASLDPWQDDCAHD